MNTHPTVTGTTSHPASTHAFNARHLQLRDDVACVMDGCTVTVTRCPSSELWPWSCAHCGPFAAPHIFEPITPGRPAAAPMTVAHPVAVQQATTTPPTTPPTHVTALDVDRESFREADLHDIVTALTEPTRHRQPYSVQQPNPDGTHTWVTRRWETTSPALLDQLGSAVEQSKSAQEGPRPAFASKPSARIDAIDGLQRITTGAEGWLRRLSLEVPYLPGPHGTSVVDVKTAIRRAAANVTDGSVDGRALRKDVRSWWILARITTGWDAPAWRPRNSCPLCAATGGLRIRFDVSIGICQDCGGEWDSQTIGLLADHIRAENDPPVEVEVEGQVGA